MENTDIDNFKKENVISIKEQLQLIFDERGEIPCDYSVPQPDISPDDQLMPSWYDKVKFKRGQKYVHDNLFGIFTSHLCGLITLLSMPEGLPLIEFTGMSSRTFLSYRRYVGTIKHLLTWYSSNFEPESEGWKSIIRVRKLHSSASKRGRKAKIKSISQRFMCLSQFGFMGYPLIRSKDFGISTESPEDVEAFIHMWKVLGWLLGIDDKYNICRSSVEETKQLCEIVLYTVFRPATRSTEPSFINITNVVFDSLWYVIPFIYKEPFMAFLYRITEPVHEMDQYEELCKISYPYVKKFKLDSYEGQQLIFTPYKRHLYGVLRNLHLKYYNSYFWKLILNYFVYISLFFIDYFPILAFVAFGFKKSFVNILPGNKTKV